MPLAIGNIFRFGIKDPEAELERLEPCCILLSNTDVFRHEIANDSLMLMLTTFPIIISIGYLHCSLSLALWCWTSMYASKETKSWHTHWSSAGSPFTTWSATENCFISLWPGRIMLISPDCYFLFTDKLKMVSGFIDPWFQYQNKNNQVSR